MRARPICSLNLAKCARSRRSLARGDPFVSASQVRTMTRNSVVTLLGQVPKQSEREMAEADAWYVFGVNAVINELEVRP